MVDHACDSIHWPAAIDAADARRRRERRIRAAWLIAAVFAFALGFYLSTALGDLFGPDRAFEPTSHRVIPATIA